MKSSPSVATPQASERMGSPPCRHFKIQSCFCLGSAFERPCLFTHCGVGGYLLVGGAQSTSYEEAQQKVVTLTSAGGLTESVAEVAMQALEQCQAKGDNPQMEQTLESMLQLIISALQEQMMSPALRLVEELVQMNPSQNRELSARPSLGQSAEGYGGVELQPASEDALLRWFVAPPLTRMAAPALSQRPTAPTAPPSLWLPRKAAASIQRGGEGEGRPGGRTREVERPLPYYVGQC
jgi:hypothetical protein